MSATCIIVCPDCDGSGDGPHGFCPFCMAQGHVAINRGPDGAVPTHDESGRAVREFVPLTLPAPPENPLVPLYQRCIP